MKLSVITLTNDKPELLFPFLESLKLCAANPQNIQVLIGDTGLNKFNKEETCRILESFCPTSKILKLKYHFSRNNNAIAKHAVGNVLLFANNDIYLRTIGFEDLIFEKFSSDEAVGIVGAKLLFPDKTIQHAGVKHIKYGPNKNLATHAYYMLHNGLPAANKSELIDAVTGAFLAIKHDIFTKVNGFDEVYAEECQDVDLCYKVREIGFEVLYEPKLTAYHLENGTRKINDFCGKDRDIFRRRWSKYNPVSTNENKRILIDRKGARGDVIVTTLLTMRLMELTNYSIDLRTEFPFLASQFDVFDRVFSYDEPMDFSEYAFIINAEYENEIWRYVTLGFIDAMKLSMGLGDTIIDYPAAYRILGDNILIQKDPALHNYLKNCKYVVVSLSAGWGEKCLPIELVDDLIEFERKQGCSIVCLTSAFDQTRHDENIDFYLEDLSVADALHVIENAKHVYIYDSYLLHVAMMSKSYENITLFTCKTNQVTVFGSKILKEIRINTSIKEMAACDLYGCRFKVGNGQGFNCDQKYHDVKERLCKLL